MINLIKLPFPYEPPRAHKADKVLAINIPFVDYTISSLIINKTKVLLTLIECDRLKFSAF